MMVAESVGRRSRRVWIRFPETRELGNLGHILSLSQTQFLTDRMEAVMVFNALGRCARECMNTWEHVGSFDV